MADIFEFGAFSPAHVAERVEHVGVTKARLRVPTMLVLGILAGGFIGFGALLFTLVTSDASLSFALSRLLGGLGFSLGLILVVVAGAELFTGNNLLVMAWVSRRITTSELLRNWFLVYMANLVGAVGLAVLVLLSNHGAMNQGGVAENAIRIAEAKTALSFMEAFFKGILCNTLVCLAVWIAMAGRGVADKIVAIVFPITAFVAAGFEHSIANMYFIPLGILLQGGSGSLSWAGMVQNLVPVTLGNIVGGSVFVALAYYFVYRLRTEPAAREAAPATNGHVEPAAVAESGVR